MTDPSLAPSATAPPMADVGTETSAPPRWHAHTYNRPGLYRLAASMGWLPRPSRLALARALGRAAPRLFPAERAVIRSTLDVMTGATGTRLDELTAGVFRDFAMCFSDLVTTNRQPSTRLTAHVSQARGTERLTELAGGMISLTAHVGNWEMAGRLLAHRSARATHVVVAEEEVRALERWVRRDGDGVRFVARNTPTVSLQLVAALRRGEVVAVQGDRALGTRGDTLVPFFGRPAPFPRGPFVLARALRVPLVPAFCMLGSDYRYTVTMPEPLTVEPGGEDDALRTWVALLEDAVRRHPTQWFNFFDIWNPLGA
jgi:lauroyl/myristoyl acyltransferase